MAATVWTPYTDTYHPESIVMANEITVRLPALEISGSGRRMRFAGNSKSFGPGMLTDELAAWAHVQATAMGTQPWFYKASDAVEKLYRERHCGGEALSQQVTFNLLSGDRNTSTSALWLFKHPTLPIQAHVVVTLASTYYGISVQTSVQYRGTAWAGSGQSLKPVYAHDWDDWDVPHPVEPSAAEDMFRNRMSPNTLKPSSMTFSKTAYRTATRHFLTQCQAMDGLAYFDIPDYRDPQAPTWLTLDLVGTNYTSQFEQELKLFLDTEETAKQLKTQISELVKTLRSLGTVVTIPADEDTAYADAAMGSLHRLNVTMDNVSDYDNAHKVLLNLVDGTVRVACGRGEARGEAANAYEIAKFKAELTGNLEQFTQFVDTQAVSVEAEKIIREHTSSP